MKVSISWCSALFILVALVGSCGSSRQSEGSEAPVTAQWQSQPLTIDGADRDWTKPLPHTVREENISYAISNDQQNLYILLSTRSPQEQQKIIQGGMSVWVNTKGDKSNGDAVGIGYPLDERNNADRNLMAEAQPQRYQNNKPVTLEDKRYYALYGFGKDSGIRNYSYGDSNYVGVQMRMDYSNSGDLIYEAAIPLQTLYPGHNPSTPYTTQHLAVGIFIEGLPPSAHVPRQGGGSPVGVGVGGGIGTGGFGSGMGLGLSIGSGAFGGGRRSNKQMFDEAQIWQTVQLARR
ncbi:MAG TPA: hypothetical protein VG052_07830 [Puia sp.]|jgi:hypothetical protein|nr:hypothetical protein [Puia sp.]